MMFGVLLFFGFFGALFWWAASDSKKANARAQANVKTTKITPAYDFGDSADLINKLQEFYKTLKTPQEKSVIERFAKKYGLSLLSYDEKATLAESIGAGKSVTKTHQTIEELEKQVQAAHKAPPKPSIDGANYLFFFGALLIVAAILFFERTTAEIFGPAVRFATIAFLIAGFYSVGAYVYKKKAVLRPAGITFLWISLLALPILGASLYQDVLGSQNGALAWFITSVFAIILLSLIRGILKETALQYAWLVAGLSSILALQSTIDMPLWTLSIGTIFYAAFLFYSGNRAKPEDSEQFINTAHVITFISLLGQPLVATEAGQVIWWQVGLNLIAAAAFYAFASLSNKDDEALSLRIASYGLTVVGLVMLLEPISGLRSTLSATIAVLGACGAWIFFAVQEHRKNQGLKEDWLWLGFGLLILGAVLVPTWASAAVLGLLTSAVLIVLLIYVNTPSVAGIMGLLHAGTLLAILGMGDNISAFSVGWTFSALSIGWLVGQIFSEEESILTITRSYAIVFAVIGLSALISSRDLYIGGICLALWSAVLLIMNTIRPNHEMNNLGLLGIPIATVMIFSFEELRVYTVIALAILLAGFATTWLVSGKKLHNQPAMVGIWTLILSFFQVNYITNPMLSAVGYLLMALAFLYCWRVSRLATPAVQTTMALLSAISLVISGAWIGYELAPTVSSIKPEYELVGMLFAGMILYISGFLAYEARPTVPGKTIGRLSSVYRFVGLGTMLLIAFGQTTPETTLLSRTAWAGVLLLSGILASYEGHLVNSGFLRYGGSVIGLISVWIIMDGAGIENFHAYTHVTAAYLFGLAVIVSIYRKNKETVDMLILLGLMTIYIPLTLAGISGNNSAGLALLLETTLGLMIGAVLQSKIIMLASGVMLALSITYRVSSYVAQVPAWVWYFLIGTALIGFGIWMVNKKEE